MKKMIKFSHSYNKMPFEDWIPNTKLAATLLEVFVAEKKALSEGFIEYDTSYFVRDYSTSETFLKKQHYQLPNGKLLILLLQTSNSSGLRLWTTVRRHTPAKEEYYRKLRGEKLIILIDDKAGWVA